MDFRLDAGMIRSFFTRRRPVGGWTPPRRFDRNLVVIGAGSAGLISAQVAAVARAKVTLVEAHAMGGDCLNYGCVPSKALIRSAAIAHQMRHADRYGLHPSGATVPFAQVMARVRRAIADIAPHDSVERYEAMGVEVLAGHARIADPWTVEVSLAGGAVRRLTTRAIILATGAAPAVPDVPGLQQAGFLTTDTLWDNLGARAEAPARLAILGGGPVGCELAQALARLGSAVTLVEMTPRLLPREDEDVSAAVQAKLGADGVSVLTDATVVACGVAGEARWIDVEGGGARHRIACDEIVVAVGRVPRLAGLGLETLGIPTDRPLAVNGFMQTRFPSILVAGDVVGRLQFTHTASHQAWYAAMNALFGTIRRFRVDERVLPRAIFTDPEVARVGLSEAEARDRGIAVEVTRYGIDDLDRAITDGSAEGFVKVLTVPGRDRILGVTIVGDRAGDMIAEFALAMRNGLGLGAILRTVHIYPTWAEANRFAAGAWRRARLSPRLLRLAERYHGWRRG